MSPAREDVIAFLSQLHAAASGKAADARASAERQMETARRSTSYARAQYYASDADRSNERATHHQREADMFQAAVLFLEGR